jgi:hypothetical protein
MDNERGQLNDDGKECIHHWLLDERNFGICKKCAARKQFCGWWDAASVQRGLHLGSGKVRHGVRGSKS